MKRPPRAPAPTVVRRLVGSPPSTPVAAPTVRPPSQGAQVYRRPDAAAAKPLADPLAPRAVVAAPRPVVERSVVERPVVERQAAPTAEARPAFRPRAGKPGAPPTPEAVKALADREHVPLRIARGALEGKMPCRVWRKKEAPQAALFDAAYAMVAKFPDLPLDTALSLAAGNQDPVAYLATLAVRKAKATRAEGTKAALRARGAVDNAAVEGFLKSLIESQKPVALVGERLTTLGSLSAVSTFAFEGEFGSRKKLEVLALAPPTTWLALHAQAGGIEIDPALSNNPRSVSSKPKERAFFDPRPFLDHVGHRVQLKLLNGMVLCAPLLSTGGFDLLVGSEAATILVPIHALAAWVDLEAETEASPPAAS